MNEYDAGRELLILGLLRRSPMSAYALSSRLRSHAPLYRQMRRGNVYHAVARLFEKGLLLGKKSRSERGRQTTKIEYRLSAAGERRFHALLEQIICDVQAPDPSVEIAYVLLGQLRRADAVKLLAQRSQKVGEQERRLTRIIGDVQKRRGSGYLAMSHTVQRLRGEQRFLRESMALLENEKWSAQWDQDVIGGPSPSL
jgi:DNA-binding PadR family transcriptional regulator